MKRSELEHIIRASSAISEDNEIIAIGSQAILGQFPDAPAELLRSMELDVFPKHHPERSIVIDGAIGEQSTFHHTFGYYAHGVAPETAILPLGWEDRLIPVKNENTHGATGWCLEVHDLAASKLAAGREKDLEFVAGLLRHQMVEPDLWKSRIMALEVDMGRKRALEQRLNRLVASNKKA
jgi:hypothetical protein